jgi:valyl-tRNA synthetase
MNREIPIITDTYVDASFGSGAVKITPAHDPTTTKWASATAGDDYRHRLRREDDRSGGEYSGQTREEARKAVVRALQTQDLLEKIDDYTHSVAHCDRTGTVIEPLFPSSGSCA